MGAENPLNMVASWEAGGGLLLGLVHFIFGGIFHLTGIVAGVAGKLLDSAIKYSIQTPEVYKEGIALDGWGICRDLANLGFIFILIFIGIATILQLQTYSYKKVLVGVIIAALLVNFSMSITLMVIDASNLVAMEFICKMDETGKCSAENISATLSKGIGYHSVTGATNEENLKKGLTPGKAVITYSFGSVLLLVVAFVLGAGAFLFIIRTITLMFLIIFAPLAFVAMALKSGLGTTWWKKLLNQSFFAPIYMFFIFLVTGYFTGTHKGTTNPNETGFYELVTNPNVENTAIAMQFVVACALIIASLVIAKQMGAYGAGGAINMGNRMRKSAVGYAGRISKRGVAKATGGYAQKAAESDTIQRMATMPVFGKATRPLTLALNKLSAEKQKGDEAKAKSYASMAPGSLASVLPTLSQNMQKQVISKVSEEQLGKTAGKMHEEVQLDTGRKIKDDQARNKFARATRDLETGAMIQHKTDTLTKDQVGSYYESLNIQQRQNLNYEKLAKPGKNTEAAMEAFIEKTDAKDFSQIATVSRKNVENISEALKEFGKIKGTTGVTGALSAISKQNRDLAKHLSSSPGSTILLNPAGVRLRAQKGAQKVTTTNPPPAPTP